MRSDSTYFNRVVATRIMKEDFFRLEDLAEQQKRSMSDLIRYYILKGLVQQE